MRKDFLSFFTFPFLQNSPSLIAGGFLEHSRAYRSRPSSLMGIGFSPTGLLTGWFVSFLILFSGLLINGIQLLICCLVFFPSSTRLALHKRLANLWWPLWIFLVETWGGVDYEFTGHSFSSDDGGNYLLLGNHLAGMDFINGVAFSSIFSPGGCGGMISIIKNSLFYLPAIGLTLFMQGSLFLKRNWQVDRPAIEKHLKALKNEETGKTKKNSEDSFWIGIYPEGTRASREKIAAAQEYSRLNNLPVLKHLLLPRSKGFLLILEHLQSQFHGLYDCTNHYTGKPLIFLDVFLYGFFQTEKIHIHSRKFPIEEIPTGGEEEEKGKIDFLMNLFVEKDEIIEFWKYYQHFPRNDEEMKLFRQGKAVPQEESGHRKAEEEKMSLSNGFGLSLYQCYSKSTRRTVLIRLFMLWVLLFSVLVSRFSPNLSTGILLMGSLTFLHCFLPTGARRKKKTNKNTESKGKNGKNE